MKNEKNKRYGPRALEKTKGLSRPAGIFGDFMRKARMSAGFTQGQVAKKLSYGSPQFISNWERGTALPPTEKLRAICRLYKVQPSEVLQKLLEQKEQELKVALF